jgi:hypothetical protein
LQTSALPLGYGAGDSKPKMAQRVPQSCGVDCERSS